uniref:Minor tail protein n=1 Tax=Siphoviridae sp. ctKXi8 TaxID=2826244 RepID=A0A8S5MY54_9CAUD|nr:MAG TPA: minor tail protein [Siphoviridae sp. ctKXi8]
MTGNVEIQGLEFQIQENSEGAVSGINNLKKALSGLRGATSTSVTGLNATSQSIRTLKNALSGLNSGDMSKKLTQIATGLRALESAKNIKISSSIANQLNALNAALANVRWTDGDKLRTLADGLRPLSELGKANMTTFINQLRKLPTVIEELEKADIDKFTQQMKELAAAMKPFADEMQKVSNGFSAFPSRIQRLIRSTEQYNGTVRRATNSTSAWNKVANGLKFGTMIYGLSRLASMIGTAITKSNEYQENLNLFTVAMGEYAEEAFNYGKTVSEILGIDLSDWIRNQGVFNTLLTGFGDTAERAALMSKNLTQLGYDLSSFFNISVEDAMQKLQSGISGELEPLRRLGYDLSQARLEAVALSLGIDKSVMSMTQAEKAELRYYAIMTQVTTAQGDLARTLEAPANQLRVLSAQFNMAARAIGNIFIPALNAILPYAIAVVQVIREIANAIASLFGFEMTEVDYSGITAGASGAGSMADSLDEAAGAAKKLKQYTAGFDELNVFSPDSGSAGSGVGAGGGNGFDFELPEYDFIGEAIQTRVGEIKAMIENSLADITAVVSGFSLAIGTIMVLTGANIPLGLGLMVMGAAGLVGTISANWGSMNGQLASTLATITGMLGGFFLALGALLTFTGANVPLGIALMAVGAVSLVTAVAVNWHASDTPLKDALATLTAIVGGSLLAVGALLAFSGGSVPLGIALMAAGAISIVGSAALNWNGMNEQIGTIIGTLTGMVSGALLALGALFVFTGVSLPLGLALLAAGAVSLVTSATVNWQSTNDTMSTVLGTLTAIVGGAMLAVGALLTFGGVNLPLGLALMAAGAISLVTAAVVDWTFVVTTVKTILQEIGIAAGAALLALGVMLTLSGGALPLGIGLIAAGAATLAAGVALNWNYILTTIKNVLKEIGIAAGGALVALGLMLIVTGVGLPLGIGLLLAGAATMATSVALNWDFFADKIQQMLDGITAVFKGFVNGGLGLFENFINGVIGIVNNVISFISGLVGILGIHIDLIPEVSIPRLATGGFVDEGQLFIANEAGAEMVGAMGRRTVVANNEQIVEGISAGVTVANDGVIAAIYALMNLIDDKDLSVSIGDDVIGRSYDRYSRNRGVRVNSGAFSNAY